jgi:predicted Holliday junction resolvase-like endonuclease
MEAFMSQAVLLLALLLALVFAVMYLRARADIEARARQRYEQWRAADLERVTAEQRALARREASAELDQWKGQSEASIRQDAIDRSRSVIIGKVTEHLTPWLPSFPYNPKDARFIGSPIDMIIFDGADEDELRRIVFLEIKTNSSGLSARQRRIRDVVRSGRIEWQELRIPTEQAAAIPSGLRRLLK